MIVVIGNYVTCSHTTTQSFSIIPKRPYSKYIISSFTSHHSMLNNKEIKGLRIICRAMRRRVRYEEDEEFDGEEYGHNEEIAMLEIYSQKARDEVLLVKALVDDKQVEVLIFKGFSSCLSYGTSPDPSRSVLPARAAIISIDIVEGPFDPSNIRYLQKGLTWEEFKSQFLPN